MCLTEAELCPFYCPILALFNYHSVRTSLLKCINDRRTSVLGLFGDRGHIGLSKIEARDPSGHGAEC
jgi:hypothetical protein